MWRWRLWRGRLGARGWDQFEHLVTFGRDLGDVGGVFSAGSPTEPSAAFLWRLTRAPAPAAFFGHHAFCRRGSGIERGGGEGGRDGLSHWGTFSLSRWSLNVLAQGEKRKLAVLDRESFLEKCLGGNLELLQTAVQTAALDWILIACQAVGNVSCVSSRGRGGGAGKSLQMRSKAARQKRSSGAGGWKKSQECRLPIGGAIRVRFRAADTRTLRHSDTQTFGPSDVSWFRRV